MPFIEIDSPYDGAVMPRQFPMEGDLLLEQSDKDVYEVWCKSKPDGGMYSAESQATTDPSIGGWVHNFSLNPGTYELMATLYSVATGGAKTSKDSDSVNNVIILGDPVVRITSSFPLAAAAGTAAAAPAVLISGTYALGLHPGSRVVVTIAQRSRKRKLFRPKAVFDAIMRHDGPPATWRVEGKAKPAMAGIAKRPTAMAVLIDSNGHTVAFTSRVNF